jgi:hypothetical protein
MLRDAVRTFGVRGRGLIGIYLADKYLERVTVPLFFFQKPAGASGMLLPDIDFLHLNHYVLPGDLFYDSLDWTEKTDHAVFAGATTGSGLITAETVRLGTNQRLRAATFFKDRREVTFALPSIVQYDAPETKALIEELGVSGQRRTWHEQFASRFVLSMDGNGATCSRVAIALHSRSILVKYASANQLYYFHGLVPWRHYIPVRANAEVIRLVREAPAFAARNERIAAESRVFAQTYLSRVAVLRYSAAMLSRYLALFGEDGGDMAAPDTDHVVDVAATYASGETIWAPPGDWASHASQAILGVALEPGAAVAADDLIYRAVGADGAVTPWHCGRQHCRIEPAGGPLHGLAVTLRPDAAEDHAVEGELRFADGSVRPITGAAPAPYPAPLTGLRLTLVARGSASRFSVLGRRRDRYAAAMAR